MAAAVACGAKQYIPSHQGAWRIVISALCARAEADTLPGLEASLDSISMMTDGSEARMARDNHAQACSCNFLLVMLIIVSEIERLRPYVLRRLLSQHRPDITAQGILRRGQADIVTGPSQ